MGTIPDIQFVKRLLKSKKFRGTYVEKRFCKDIQQYKDIVLVRSTEESNMSLDFNLFLEILSQTTHWIGLTRNSNAAGDKQDEFCIWTDLEADSLPFNEYDFEIRTVRTTDSVIQLKLRVLEKPDSKNGGNISDGPSSFDITAVNWKDYEPKKIVNASLGFLLSIQWNWAAIKQSIEFVLVTIVYLISEIPNIIRFTGEWTIHIFRELNNLIFVCTPIFMALVDMTSKIVGVTFMLISNLIRSRNPPESSLDHRRRPQQLTYR